MLEAAGGERRGNRQSSSVIACSKVFTPRAPIAAWIFAEIIIQSNHYDDGVGDVTDLCVD